MTTLDLIVALVGLLSLLNAVAVAALIRQVRVLHLRIRPVAGLQGAGGPAHGTQLTLPTLLRDLTGSASERFLIGFLSPTCGVCGPLTTAFGQVAKSLDADTSVLLVIDATAERAQEYLEAKGIGHLPRLADHKIFTANVPGTPWAVVADEAGSVISSGAVNTLDNIEEMLAEATAATLAPSTPGALETQLVLNHSTEGVQDVS
jgi:hypothetical protein